MSERRLPIYLVVDTSGSMSGEPIQAVNMGLQALVNDLQNDQQAMENAYLSVITFESSAKVLVPLTEVGSFQAPTLQIGGSTNLRDGLKLLCDCIEKEVRKNTPTQKGDYKPMVFLLTDGFPDTGWEAVADEVKKKKPANIIACAAGPSADTTSLKRFTEVVIKLQDTKPGTLGAFMKWVTQSAKIASASVGAKGDAPINLPALPVEQGIQIVP
jgi:uncharacterized protein YegL